MFPKRTNRNASFVQFLSERGYERPRGYGMARTSLAAAYKSFSKYDKGQPYLDEVAWQRAGDWTESVYRLHMGDSDILGEEYVLTQMDKTTSCGYPWNLKFKNKNEFLADRAATAVLSDFWNLFPSKPPTLWKVTQKREMLPDEKIKAGKVRTFTAAAIELSVFCNRLFLDMNEKFYTTNLTTTCKTFVRGASSFVGASKYAGGWNRLYQSLSAHPNAFALDESAYDASLFVRAMEGVRDLRFRCLKAEWRTPEVLERVRFAYSNIIGSIAVMEDCAILQKTTGNPSGSTNTIVDNTLILHRLFCYAWLVLADRNGVETTHTHFQNNVCAALNGDDNTFTVSDECVCWFNPRGIADVWHEIGVKTTPSCPRACPLRQSDLAACNSLECSGWESRPLSHVDFLSQHFVCHEGCYYPMPDTQKVLNSLYLASSSNDIRWHYLRACALRIESYWNLTCRNIVSDYIVYLAQHYAEKMVDDEWLKKKGMTMESINAVYMSDDQIEALYSGKESSVNVAIPWLDDPYSVW